jgi:2-dehydropantoate 2-reductase
VDARLDTVREALEAAGCQVALSNSVMAVKWTKLVINLGNAFYAITDLSIPEGHRSPESRAYLADVMEEGVRVLEAAGVGYEPLPSRPGLLEEIERLRQPAAIQPWPETPDVEYYSSTWQDLQLQRGTTEVAFLNGEIISLGRQFGIPTPINELLQTVVEEMAANGEQPGKYTVSEFRAMCDTR